MMERTEGVMNPVELPERRRADRSRTVLMMARLEAELADDICLICNISPLGARVRTAQELAPGQAVRLDFGDALVVAGTVRWAQTGECGIEFERPADLAPLFAQAAESDAGRPVFVAPQRAHPRLRRCAHVVVRHAQGAMEADLYDVSPAGARLDLADPAGFALGDRVSFAIEDRFDCEGRVRWVGQRSIGVTFDAPLRIWKLEKWLLDSLDQCGECEATECSAPSFGRALANRTTKSVEVHGSQEREREGE